MIRKLLVGLAIAAVALGAAPTAGADPADQLKGLLPAGYGTQSCQVAQSRHPGAVATLECQGNSLPGGPTYARYELYADHDTLTDAFTEERTESRQAYWWFEPCPDSGATVPAPQTQWDAGWAVCGKVNGPVHGDPDAKAVMWTKDSNLFLGIAEGPELASLYGWWKQVR